MSTGVRETKSEPGTGWELVELHRYDGRMISSSTHETQCPVCVHTAHLGKSKSEAQGTTVRS